MGDPRAALALATVAFACQNAPLGPEPPGNACDQGWHDGGGGVCVPAGTCLAGYGIPAGGDECVPLAEACPPAHACRVAAGWSEGACSFSAAEDGTACEGTSEDRCATEFSCEQGACLGRRPGCRPSPRVLVFVHGINGSSANFRVMAERLVADGWPREHLYLFDAADPSWGCNVDNAAAIAALVARAREETCAARVDLVAHSMGTLSSRWFMKFLGGHEVVNTYVTLGGMHHGLSSPCWAPDFLGVCVWQELCAGGEVIEKLNADPAIAGAGHWVSIYGTGDSTVPNESSHLEGAENIAMPGVEHSGAQGLLEDEATYLEVRRVLGYPCW